MIVKKILIIRFSSIGDIVLTTPVIRCLKTQLPDAEIHFLTKRKYGEVLKASPYIDRMHLLDQKLSEVIPSLKKENFDQIIDLHKNFRSIGVRIKLKKPASSFPKINFQKWLLVHFKKDYLPKIHIVDRYFKAVEKLQAKNDGNGLDYFLDESDRLTFNDLPEEFKNGFIGIVIGGMHFTKILPTEMVIKLIKKLNKPVILMGGPDDFERGEAIVTAIKGAIFNSCGKYSINQSAALVSLADKIVTNDTGLMHIAAAFRKEVLSVWGNTIPEFGMYPYLPDGSESKSHLFEVKNLSCRPCHKIGLKNCPRKHFNCMNQQDLDGMAKILNQN